MKYPRFKSLGGNYPHALEEKYGRILGEIDGLWDKEEIGDYFTDLLLDKRGGRKGFPPDVLADIVRLSQYREIMTLKQAEKREDAIASLVRHNIKADHDSLFSTVETGDQEVLDWLLRAGVSVHAKDKNGTPPLITALMKGYTVVAQMLLKAGADVNGMDRRGFTPLLLACGKPVHGYKAVAETLIRKGAVINFRDALGNTPLLLALSGGTADIAELLIEHGADIYATTKRGESALSLAQKAGNTRLANLLRVKQEEHAEKKSKR